MAQKPKSPVKYGLLHKETNKLLGYSISNNGDSNDCVDYSYTLETDAGNVWLVDNDYGAAYVRQFSTAWYNAGYETPMHKFKPEELEVVKVIQNVEVVDITVPTFEEYMLEKYGTKGKEYYDKRHYDLIIGQYRLGDKAKMRVVPYYSIYDLHFLLWAREDEAKKKKKNGAKK